MQNRYVGDVGDYGKYALLRALCQPAPEIALAVIWCLFPDESHNNDGRHISYLRDKRFVQLDPDLHEKLAHIVFRERRSLSEVEKSGCLPVSTVFCSEPISATHIVQDGASERRRYRAEWLSDCLHRTRNCDLAFFDPDNGLEIASVAKHQPKAGKYIYWDELVPFWRRGNSLLIYHHLNRTESASNQVEMLARRCTTELYGANPVPLVFRRGSSRVFWLIHHVDPLGCELQRRARDMLNSGWSRHFQPFGWPNTAHAAASAP
jgi:hypothetical protein